MTLANRRRSAFTLIELLVVIAILTTLAALSAGTYFRIRSTQQVNSTESTLQKLDTGLLRLYSADRDQAEKEFTSGKLIAGVTMEKLLGFAGGPNEKDRAKAIYLYFRMKYEYPQTFPEAKANVTLGTFMSAPPKQMFRNLPNVTPTTPEEANFQAAVLLYMILDEKSSHGETFDTASLQAFIAERTTASGTYRVFIDSWGTPITYVRFLTNDEINNQPHSRNASSAFANPASLPAGLSNNPFDVSARFVNTGWTNFPTFVTAAAVVTAVPNTSQQEKLLRANFLPSVVSAGPDKTFTYYLPAPPNPPNTIDTDATLDVRGRSATPFSNIGIIEHGPKAGVNWNDNIYGYRLRKFGARGD